MGNVKIDVKVLNWGGGGKKVIKATSTYILNKLLVQVLTVTS
jgi:hypothetical protein